MMDVKTFSAIFDDLNNTASQASKPRAYLSVVENTLQNYINV